MTDVNVPTECNKKNKLKKKLFFVGILDVIDEKSRIRSRIQIQIWIRKLSVPTHQRIRIQIRIEMSRIIRTTANMGRSGPQDAVLNFRNTAN
jgi:hypothetical protein